MTTANAPKPTDALIAAGAIEAAEEYRFLHPFDAATEVRIKAFGDKTLSEAAGLKRTAVHKVRIAPGKSSFPYHFHHREEEWVYVLSGSGVADVGDQTLPIGPGDFLGFPPGGFAHEIRNPGAEDLVYLTGGERHELEVVDFPRVEKRMVRFGSAPVAAPLSSFEIVWKDE